MVSPVQASFSYSYGSGDSGQTGAGGDIQRPLHMAAVGSGEVQAAFHDGNSFRDSAEDGFCFCRVCPEFQVSRSGFGQGRAVGRA